MQDAENFDSIIDDLTPVEKNVSYSKQNSDLLFNEDKGNHGKFMVSESLFLRLNLNNHGFQLYVGRGEAYVAVVPNEDAVTYRGRPDYENKSKEFASTTMRDALDDVGMEGNEFWLEFAGTKDDTDYYRIVDEDPQDEEEEQMAQEMDASEDVGHTEEATESSF